MFSRLLDPLKECHDHPRYRDQCLDWREKGECKTVKSVQKICRRTCNTCLTKRR